MSEVYSPAQLAAIQQYYMQSHLMQNTLMCPPSGFAPAVNLDAPTVVSDEEEDVDDTDQRTLYCGNVDERVTEEQFYELFMQAGPLESISLPKEPNGKRRTFGFVVYAHACSVPYALKLYDGLRLFDKNVQIRNKGNNNNKFNGPLASQRHSLPAYPQNNMYANPFALAGANMGGSVSKNYATMGDLNVMRHERNARHNAKPYDRRGDQQQRGRHSDHRADDRYSHRQDDRGGRHQNRERHYQQHRQRRSDPQGGRRY